MMHTRSLTVQIDNLTDAQAIALEDMFAEWMRLGSWGSSRWTAFFADGDGDFRPRITVNGKKPEMTDIVKRSEVWTHCQDKGIGKEYRIDFDKIAWRLHG